LFRNDHVDPFRPSMAASPLVQTPLGAAIASRIPMPGEHF
jgi:hypothetical protein